MNIYLNGKEYILRQGSMVTRQPVQEWPNNLRLDGQQQRKDRRLLSSWAIDGWNNGLGVAQINVATASDLTSLRDAENVDTRFPSQIINSPVFNTATIVPSRADLDLAFEYLGDLYFMETERAHEAGTDGGYVYQFSAPFQVGSYGRLATQGPVGVRCGSISAIRALGGKIAFIGWNEDNNKDRLGRVLSLGGTPTSDASGLGQFDSVKSVYPQLSDLGGTLHALYHGNNSNRFHFVVADLDAMDITNVGTIAGEMGTYMAPLITDGVTMYAQLPDGIYDFDITPSKIINTESTRELNTMQTLFQNELYFKNGKSLVHYNGSDLEAAGYDRRDALVREKFGEITALTANWQFQYAAVKGLTYSHILTRDSPGAWQYYARIPTVGVWVRELFLSNTPDGIDRLWCIFGSYGYPGYFLEPRVNPLSAATYSWVPTGHFTPPVYGGDMPEESGGFFDISVRAGAIGSNVILVDYGIDGVDPDSALGTVGTTQATLQLGDVGTQGYTIQPKFTLFSSTEGTTPVYRHSVVHYLKQPDTRERYDMEIDVNHTARYWSRTTEDVLSELDTVYNSRPLVPFWYGQIGTKNVKALLLPSNEEVKEQHYREGERAGHVRIQLAEIV